MITNGNEMTELCTIITVCYNSEEFIKQTIESVLYQTYKNFEYIIVDGGSSDETLNIIKSYEPKFDGRLRWISEPDGGIYDAMNKGILLAKGKWIGIINSDDWYEQEAISMIANLFSSNNDIQLIHGKIRIIDFNNNFKKIVGGLEDVKRLSYKDFMPICHPSSFVRIDVYNKLGLFNQQYKIAADYDFVMRCVEDKINIRYIDEIICNFRDGGISNTNWKKSLKESLIIKKIYDNSRIIPYITFLRSYLINYIKSK